MKTTFYWSLGGHVFFFLVLAVVSLITSCSRNRQPKEVHIFRLQAGPPAPRVAVAPPQQIKPKLTQPRPQKEQPKPQPQKPIPKPEPKKPEPKPPEKVESKPVSYNDFLKENKLPEPNPEPVQPTPTPPPQDSNQELRKELEQIIQGFGGTDTSSDQMQEFNRYIGQLRGQLNRLWLQPDNLPPGKWSALVEFTVQQNGKVVRVHFKQKSGNLDFDQSLIRAMNAFVTTTPPPGGKAQVFAIPFSMTVR